MPSAEVAFVAGVIVAAEPAFEGFELPPVGHAIAADIEPVVVDIAAVAASTGWPESKRSAGVKSEIGNSTP